MGVRNHIVCDAAPRPPALADTARVPGVSGGLKLAVALLASVGLALGCSGQAPSDPDRGAGQHVAGVRSAVCV